MAILGQTMVTKVVPFHGLVWNVMPSLQDQYLHSGLGKYGCGDSAARARADDDRIPSI
jgi:hypothetical protein